MEYEIKNGEACITGGLSFAMIMDVPEKIEGYPVTEIGAYAFSERMGDASVIEEMILPPTIRRIGRYAFYNCRNLKRIQLYNTVADLGAGAFTGCHQVREIDITFVGDEKSCLKEFLIDLPEEQTVYIHGEKGDARFVFPEYFEEAVENTPARILETHTHGSGMMYRNCFVQRELKRNLYDERFEWAKGSESEETLFRIAFCRLLYPYELSEKAEQNYKEYLKVHLEACIRWTVKNKREKELYYLTEHCVERAEEMELLIREGNRYGEAQVLSFLMDYKHRNFKTKRKTFEL